MTSHALSLAAACLLAAMIAVSSAEESLTVTSPLFQPEAALESAPPPAVAAEGAPGELGGLPMAEPVPGMVDPLPPVTAKTFTFPPQLPPGQQWQGVAGITFAWVPAGCFVMGSPTGAEGRERDEGPQHQVCVDGFWMGIYEVTQAQWEGVMGNNPSFFNKGGKYPVESVNLKQVEEFLKRLTLLGSAHFRLPTEAEWEYACRGAGGSQAYGGKIVMLDDGEELPGWYSEDSGWYTHLAAMKEPNALGIHDMSGNVGEWVADAYQADGYARHETINPLVSGPAEAPRVRRGGSWVGDAKEMRCANRFFARPELRYFALGFRVVAAP